MTEGISSYISLFADDTKLLRKKKRSIVKSCRMILARYMIRDTHGKWKKKIMYWKREIMECEHMDI